jgi:hypothetical protein
MSGDVHKLRHGTEKMELIQMSIIQEVSIKKKVICGEEEV